MAEPAPQIGENTKVTLDLKTIGIIVGGVNPFLRLGIELNIFQENI